MASPFNFPEEECLTVYWKIKNFSYCYEKITSPSFDKDQYCLQLHPRAADVECILFLVSNKSESSRQREISFVTCDGSPAESITDAPLRLAKDVIFGNRRSSFLPEDTLTVRLRYPDSRTRGKLFICSQIGVKRNIFLWTLTDFSNNKCTTNKSVENSKLYGDMELNLKFMDCSNIDEQFYIEIVRKVAEKCYCTLEVSLLDVNGRGLNETRGEFVFEKKDGLQARIFPTFFKKSKLLECKNLLLPNDTLSLKCHFAMTLGVLTGNSADISYCENDTALLKECENLSMGFTRKKDSNVVSELKTDLKSMLMDSTDFDASLKIETDVIKVHKNILSARSPVFKAMFTKDMKEGINNAVVIEDLDIETVHQFVLYIYTDTMPDYQWENTKKLYFAADKYQVLSLRKKCASRLENNLAISNVCEALVLADLHHDGDLKTTVLNFISENDIAVFNSEEWKELGKNNLSLAFQVISEIYHIKHNKLD